MRDGVPKNLYYTLDVSGQIVRRREERVNVTRDRLGRITGATPDPSQAAPVEVFYRYAGKTMGMVGNNGTGDVDYSTSITQRSAASPAITSTNAGLFRNGTNYGSAAYADFSQSLDPYNSGQQGSAGGGTYTVRQGDTLQAIAAALYGDGNLWYRIAEANGLSAGAALSEGQSLILPAGVTKSTHNAGTFQPYDATEAMGDTLPTTPKPPKSPKCGAFGQILMVAIAVAVTALTAGTSAPLLAQVGAAMLGSAVSQGVGVALGIQDKFSFKSVALAGISAGITGGLSELSTVGNTALKAGKTVQELTGAAQALRGIGNFMKGAGVLSNAVRGIAGSALSQGVGVATGLQKIFSWTGVAAAGVGSAVGGAVGRAISDPTANMIGSTMADTIAQAATRSAIQGNSFGDNLIASLPSALGNLAGRALAAGVGTAFDGKGGKSATEVEETEGNVTSKAVAGGGGPLSWERDVLPAKFGGSGKSLLSDMLMLESDAARKKKLVFVSYGKNRYGIGSGGYEYRDAPVEPVRVKSRSAEPLRKQTAVTAKAAGLSNAEIAVSHAEFQARMDPIIASLSEPIAEPAEIQLVGDYGSIDSITTFISENWDDIPLVASHGFTISDYRSSFDALSSWSSNWIDRGLRFAEDKARYLPPDQRFRMIATSNLLSSLGQGIAAIPSAIAHPVDSGKAFFGGIAKGFDNVMAVNDTPAKEYIPAQISRAANASPNDWARATGKLGAAVLPTKFLPGAKYAPELAFVESRVYSGGAFGRLSAEKRVIERHHMPPNSLEFTTEYSGPAIQMDYADHLATSSRGSGLNAVLYRSDVQALIDSGNMRGVMAMEIRDVRRVTVDRGSSIRKYNPAIREMLEYSYGKGWLGK